MSNVVKIVVGVVVAIVTVVTAVLVWKNRAKISEFGKLAVARGEQVLTERNELREATKFAEDVMAVYGGQRAVINAYAEAHGVSVGCVLIRLVENKVYPLDVARWLASH